MKEQKVYLKDLKIYAIRPVTTKVFVTSVRPDSQNEGNLLVNFDQWIFNWN